MDNITLLSANAHAAGIAGALPKLCQMLADKGILVGAEIEILRHVALSGFDHARQHRDFSEEESEFFEKGRQHAENLWQSAAVAADHAAQRRG